jgi:peptidoglycan hydrolase-like protein with peptidoglycan-binding domain
MFQAIVLNGCWTVNTEGYPGENHERIRINGVPDDHARKAIRSFQQDNGLSITGMVDQRTADKLGVRISKSNDSQRNRSGGSQSDSHMKKQGDDQSLPSGVRN